MMLQRITVTGAFVLACMAGIHAQQGQGQTQTQKPQGQGQTQKPQGEGQAQGQGQPQGQGQTQGQTSSASKQSQSGGSLTAADKTFFTRAAESDHKEIALAQLAQQKGNSAEVKALAARIEKDHRQTSQELTTMAQSKSVTLPAAPTHDAHMAKFEKLEGAAFDRAYSSMMVQDHTNAIALFSRAAKSKDAEVRAFAEKTLPALREHLRMSKEAQGGMTSTSGTKPTGSTAKPAGSSPSGSSPSGTSPSGSKPSGGGTTTPGDTGKKY
jgi:putative membrane protein